MRYEQARSLDEIHYELPLRNDFWRRRCYRYMMTMYNKVRGLILWFPVHRASKPRQIWRDPLASNCSWGACRRHLTVLSKCCFHSVLLPFNVASVQLRRAQSEQLVIHLQTTLRVAEFKAFRKVMLSQYRAGAWMHRKQAWPPQHLEPYPSHVCLSLISLQAMCHSSLLLIMPTRLWPAWRLPTNHD